MTKTLYAVEIHTDDGYDGDLFGPFDDYNAARVWTKEHCPNTWTRCIIAELKDIDV